LRPSPASTSRSQIDQLDGVRALAVLAVMAFHIQRSATGFLGVDVFFVLSGLLITGILLGERDRRGRVDLRRFYARRLLRLYPALIAMLVLTSPFGAHLSGDDTWGSWWTSVAVAATYTANLAILADGTQFLGALGPVWSLAVEMQFYLVWPGVFVWLLGRRIDRRVLAAVVAAAAAACLSLFWLLGSNAPEGLGVAPAYFRPDARFGELLAGCALALVLSLRTGPLTRRGEWALSALAALGIGGLYVAHRVFYEAGTVAPMPIVALATALILARLVTSDRALLSRLLRVPPLPQLGRISYAMYLWQLPILTLVSWAKPTAAMQQLVFWAGTIAIAALSMRFVERPFLRRKDALRASALPLGPEGAQVDGARHRAVAG
jgi:peptidoglycan/LPS O-acetylase OafA/YrhL